MAPILSLLFLTSLLAAAAAAAHDSVLRLPGDAAAADLAGQREFDYFALALQWPGTFCSRTHYCCPNNGCCRSAPLTEFTIHGLWPDYDDGTWPACCEGPEFDVKKLSSLLPTLEKYWPTLSCSSVSNCHGGKGLFWAHEWGFAATNSVQYPLRDVLSTIERAVGASPQLICKHGSVQELHLCFDKDFKPRDCLIGSGIANNTSNSRNSCPAHISLPSYTPIVPADVSTASVQIAKGPINWVMESLWNWS